MLRTRLHAADLSTSHQFGPKQAAPCTSTTSSLRHIAIEHDHHIRTVLERFVKFGIAINPAKCIFAVHSLPFLSHIVDAQGARPNTESIDIIRWPQRGTKKELLALNNHYRFLRNAATALAPLFALIDLTVLIRKLLYYIFFTPKLFFVYNLLLFHYGNKIWLLAFYEKQSVYFFAITNFSLKLLLYMLKKLWAKRIFFKLFMLNNIMIFSFTYYELIDDLFT